MHARSYADAAAHAREAVAVLQRPLLPDDEADWLDEERRYLDERCALALETVAEASLALGEPGRATAEAAARRLVEREPTRERGHMLLMRCQAAAGNVSEAIKSYARLREVLNAGAGHAALRPGARAGRAAAARRACRTGGRAVAGGRDELPSALRRREPALEGREAELERLLAWWQGAERGVRVCMLDGDPGVGKTRLAAELAHHARGDGACVLYGRSDDEPGDHERPSDGDERTSLVPYQPIVEASAGCSRSAVCPARGPS